MAQRRAVSTRDRVSGPWVRPGTNLSTIRPLGFVSLVSLLAVAGLGLLAAQSVAAPAYPTQLASAAKTLEDATAPSGSGYQFDVLQRQVEYPKAGGPLLPIVDQADPQSIVARVDHLYVNAVLARGRVAPGAFWMEMRFGPDEETAPNFDSSPTMFGVIQKSGGLWRNDGLGWYATTVSPGVGMDPTTASLLPSLLRNVTQVKDLGSVKLTGQPARHYSGFVDISNFPGVVASDGAPFSESPVAIDLWLDTSDRLVRLEGKTRNLNESTLDLMVDTTVTFTYIAAGIAPDPLPVAPSPSVPGVTVGAP